MGCGGAFQTLHPRRLGLRSDEFSHRYASFLSEKSNRLNVTEFGRLGQNPIPTYIFAAKNMHSLSNLNCIFVWNFGVAYLRPDDSTERLNFDHVPCPQSTLYLQCILEESICYLPF